MRSVTGLATARSGAYPAKVLRAARYARDQGWSEIQHIEDVSELRTHEGTLFWAREDVRELSDEDVRLIQAEFDLPPTAVEAAVSARSRPKIEPFDDDIFAVIYELDEVEEQLEAIQIAVFVGSDFVLVLHAGAERTLQKAEHELRNSHDLDAPQQLLYILFDVLVTDYQEIVDALEDDIEEMEDIILSAPQAPVQRQLYTLKQRLARLRRYALPWGRMMDEAVEADPSYWHITVNLANLRFLRDRLLRISDQVRNVDDLTQAAIDLTRAEQGDRLNEHQRRLSAWAAVFAVATVIGGIYGMNFELVPEDQSIFGFWFALGLIFFTCGGLYLYFKHRGWL
jgi:magnesium transporter